MGSNKERRAVLLFIIYAAVCDFTLIRFRLEEEEKFINHNNAIYTS